RSLGVTASTTYTLTAASHTVELSGIAANCTVSGQNPRTVTVPTGGTTTTFSITCTALPPPTGDLTVTAATSGQDLDPDGYTVTVDGGQSRSLDVTASTTYTLTAASHTVELSGIAANCTVSGQNPRTVTVPTSGTTTTCSFTRTSSDPDGSIVSYSWTFGDGGTSNEQNPTHVYTATGSYTVTLTVMDNQGATASASHPVTVSAPPNQPPSVNAGPDEPAVTGLLYSFTWSFS